MDFKQFSRRKKGELIWKSWLIMSWTSIVNIYITIESLFIFTILNTLIRSSIVNDQNYSLKIRFWMILWSFLYVLIYASTISFMIIFSKSDICINIAFALFLVYSILIFVISIFYNNKTISAKNKWYIGTNGSSYKKNPDVSDFFWFLFGICFFGFYPIFLALFVVYVNSVYATALGCFQFFCILLVITVVPRLRKLLYKNIEYNYLSEIILEDKKSSCKRQCSERAIELFNDLFNKGIFYRTLKKNTWKRVSASNELIIKKIELYGNSNNYSLFLAINIPDKDPSSSC